MSSGTPVNILLVDDQPAKLLSYEVILRELGENLITAGSAAEALELPAENGCRAHPDGCVHARAGRFRAGPRCCASIRASKRSPSSSSPRSRCRRWTGCAATRPARSIILPVPVVPEILRAKVKIFVELHRKTRAARRAQPANWRPASPTGPPSWSNRLPGFGESEERMRLASEAAEFGTYDYDPPSDVFHSSANLKRLLGISGGSGAQAGRLSRLDPSRRPREHAPVDARAARRQGRPAGAGIPRSSSRWSRPLAAQSRRACSI